MPALFTALPLIAALLVSISGIAFAQDIDTITGIPDWASFIMSQGLAITLVIWWIMKGHPEHLKNMKDALAAQDTRHERDWKLTRDEQCQQHEAIAEELRGLRGDLRGTQKQ